MSPNGFDHHWNDGRRGRTTASVDDVGFVAALIDCVAGWLPVDRRRVYAVGISNGAMMAARLASQLPDRIAAFGQVAGTVAEDAPQLVATRPARARHPDPWHAPTPSSPTRAGAVPTAVEAAPTGARVLGVDEWAALVTGHNGATGPEVTQIPPDVTVRRWRGPPIAGDVEFWRVDGRRPHLAGRDPVPAGRDRRVDVAHLRRHRRHLAVPLRPRPVEGPAKVATIAT